VTETILVVDDETSIVEVVSLYLRREGYRVLTAADGDSALQQAREQLPDLIVLDIMLPGMSGFEVCRALRRDLVVPILMLSAREDEIDKVLGLELGADDYLTKPFGLRELLARIHALLRRVEAAAPPAAAPGATRPPEARRPLLIVGDLQLDQGARTVQRAGRVIALKPKEFDLLAFLAAHPRQVFSREILLDRVWGYDYTGGPRTVDVHIRWVRSKIETDPAHPQLIHTVYSVGYKLDDSPEAAL
jgi:DNA-binding response OmpR family regulator